MPFHFFNNQQLNGDRGKAAKGCRRTRGVCLGFTNCAKRLECAGFSGAVGRAENLERWMIPVRTKSGAEVTAVQTLREFRRRSNFAKRRGVRQPLALWGRTHAQSQKGTKNFFF
jgi:hypothetical protein